MKSVAIIFCMIMMACNNDHHNPAKSAIDTAVTPGLTNKNILQDTIRQHNDLSTIQGNAPLATVKITGKKGACCVSPPSRVKRSFRKPG